MGTKVTTPEGMRSVTLSEGTKQYLVAHRMAQLAADTVLDQTIKCWGDYPSTEKMMKPLWEKLSDFQDEIIKMMARGIEENLAPRSVTEI